MQQIAFSFEPERREYTVAGLNAALRKVMERDFSDIRVVGEVSGVRKAQSGHYYFNLKEREAVLKCVCFSSKARYLKVKPQDGLAVRARGSIDIYEARGEYQLVVEALELFGHGALQFAFEELKKKLAAEGLFEAARKRPLPPFPRRIGIVTSPGGAVIRDMLHVLERRFPGLHIQLFPALVQGEGSVEDVCRGLDYFRRSGWPEVVIVARGGGSLEDLWTFNEEAVARAIAASPVPVISAVGHETDFTIADFVADVRAPTPSAAAEIVVRTRLQVLEQIDGCAYKLQQALRFRIAMANRALHQRGIDRATSLLARSIGRSLQRVDELDYRLRHGWRAIFEFERNRLRVLDERLKRLDLRLRFARARRRLEASESAAARIATMRLVRVRGRLDPLVAQLYQLSPLRVLERGYAIVENEAGRIVTAAPEVPVDSSIAVRLARGRLRAHVTESEPG